jgi:hypothetical protein
MFDINMNINTAEIVIRTVRFLIVYGQINEDTQYKSATQGTMKRERQPAQ